MTIETLEVCIARKWREADGIVSFDLKPGSGARLPSFTAGAHIDVHVPGGIVRQYSLCNNPAEVDRYQIAVLLDPASRGGSSGMHSAVHEGDLIRISKPRNHFPLAATDGRPLLLAAGIGVTPILCMAEALTEVGADFTMHYWARSAAQTAFVDRIRSSGFARNVSFHFDNGPAHQLLSLESAFRNRLDGQRAYLCGPLGFLDAARAAARQSGWPDDRVHFEYFKPHVGKDQMSGIFEVQIASTGAVYVVPPEKTVAQVLAEHAIEIPLSCEQGICGTCITRVLEGVPDHRDLVLTAQERAKNDQFTPCCSRALSPRLVLDL